MKILHLTLKKKWFDMIASGEKKEEYREIKRYWIHRLCNEIEYEQCGSWDGVFKKFDRVIFRNGYAKNAPTLTVVCEGITIDYGMTIWGAEKDKEYFIVQLGNIIN